MTRAALDDSSFWEIIETSARKAYGNVNGIVGKVREHLLQLQPAEIISFQLILSTNLNASYSWGLWGAAYLINGGCSDDGFEYFRCWLVTRGRKVFASALVTPDSLAEVVDPDEDHLEHECESLLYVARSAYQTVTNGEMPPGHLRRSREPAGENWEFDDVAETAKRLPRLSSLYRKS